MSLLFGEYIRKRREFLRKQDASYSIRQVAKRIGIHHSYLSKVERGEPASLSERSLFALAAELGEDPELLMAMSGKLSEEVRRAVFQSPELFSCLARELKSGRSSTEQFSSEMTVLKSLRDMAVIQLDADMRVVRSGNDLLGNPAAESRVCYEYLFNRTEACEGCPVPRSRSTGEYQAGEVVVGDATWLIGTTPLFENGDASPTGFLNLAVDVTRSYQLEQSRSRAECLMLHDIRSPLAGIVTMARSLTEEENLTPDQVACLKLMEQSAGQLMNQVAGALKLHLVESGELAYNPTKVDMASLVEHVANECLTCQRFPGVTLERSVGGDTTAWGEPVWAEADEALAERMVSNVLFNAFEASREGDVIRVDLAREQSVRLEISNPCPVPAEIRDRFFEKFVSYGKTNGLGLGAYSARVIAEAMGGSMSFESSDESGTTVSIHLPS